LPLISFRCRNALFGLILRQSSSPTSSLRWTCQYADSCSIDQGVGSVCVSETECSSDLTKVRPKQTTTYVLTCGGLDGSRSYSATVNVGFIPKLKEIIPKLNFWYFKLVG
ncbi:hypothetical protein HZB06_03230, partial [Candidatus Wolfebacteria bacterium]|nr:hypothetical protein [Candidatus Wolfebacteria bacterium]